MAVMSGTISCTVYCLLDRKTAKIGKLEADIDKIELRLDAMRGLEGRIEELANLIARLEAQLKSLSRDHDELRLYAEDSYAKLTREDENLLDRLKNLLEDHKLLEVLVNELRAIKYLKKEELDEQVDIIFGELRSLKALIDAMAGKDISGDLLDKVNRLLDALRLELQADH